MNKTERRARRKLRIRKKVSGTVETPRLSVFRSLTSIYIQAVDDKTGKTLASDFSKGKNKEAAAALGAKFAQKLTESKIKTAVFDRNGFRYHGVVKALADAIRGGGIQI